MPPDGTAAFGWIDDERQAARRGLVVGQPRFLLLRIGVGRTLHDREPGDGAEREPRGLAGVVARDLAHALRRLDQHLPRLIGAPRGDAIGAERVREFRADHARRVDDGDLALHLHAAHHHARKDRRAEGADRRRQHQAEDERPREDRGREFPDRHQEDLLHAGTTFGSAPACSCARRTSVSAAADPPVTMRMKMSSRRGRAISMRPAGTALARRGMAARRVRAVHEQDLAAAVRRRDAFDFGERRERREVRVAVERLEPDRARIVLAPDRGQRIVQHLLAAVHHHHVIAQLLGVRHHVRGEENRRAALVLLVDERAERPGADRIQAAERLVEDQQIRLVDDGGQKLHLLLHALRELLAALPLAVAEADAFEAAPDAARQIGFADALEPAQVGEERADAHLPVDAALLGQVADPVLGVERGRVAEHRQLARVREDDRHHHPDRGRLAGAVRADEPVHRAARDDEIEVVDGPGGAECLRDAAEEDGCIHALTRFLWRRPDVTTAGPGLSWATARDHARPADPNRRVK